MSHQLPRSRPPAESRLTEGQRGEGRKSVRLRAAILCGLILGIALLGACGQRDAEGPDPEPGPTITSTALPAVVTYTPSPPTATNTPPPLPTVEETPTPTVTATDAAPAAIESPASDALVTVQGEMNVRSGPGTEYDVVGDATAGEEFSITGKNPDGVWWQIDFRGESGWIYAPFVIAANADDVPVVGAGMTETPVPGDAMSEAGAAPLDPVLTVGGDMNVRSGPGTEYDRVGGAFEGEEFAITGKSADDEWWQIDFEGQAGWLYAAYATATDAENVPVVDGSMSETPAPTVETEADAPPTESPVVTVHGDMNVRSGPGTEYDRIGGAFEGEEFDVTGKSADGEWWQIDFEGQSGWIYAPYVTAANVDSVPVVDGSQSPTPEPAAESEVATPTPNGPVATVAEDLDIRAGPGTDYDLLGGATAGAEFDITGKSADGEWWQIDFEGQSGWVFGANVTATNTENVPEVDSAPAPEPTATPAAQGSSSPGRGLSAAESNPVEGDVLEVHLEAE